MKQKTDESPDQWVRQTLSQLPDAPPPDSSFNPDQLWAKLRPELQSVPEPRSQTRLKGWLAAACVGALIFGWVWLSYQSTPEPIVTIAHRKNLETHVSVSPQQRSGPTHTNEPNGPERVFSAAERPRIALHRQKLQQVRLKTETAQPVSTSNALPLSGVEEGLLLSEIPAVIDKIPALPKQKIAETSHKRRFQVVHENELRAEEETQPKLYRPDHFVRLGTGQTRESQVETGRPALIMSLTNKPNQ